MKILYAAGNNANAKIQLARFLKAMDTSKDHIKIAAYKQSSPQSINIDWTLDALLNIYKSELLSLDNDNLSIYYEQIKSFAPDIVISDLEYFTSYVASALDITLWQCSSSLINYALTKFEKYNLGLFKYHAYSLNRDPIHTQRTVNMIDNSYYNLIYSHYGDIDNSPKLQENFLWVRPYHQVAKDYIPCKHYIVAGLSSNNKYVLNILKKYEDSVAFMEFDQEHHKNVIVKDIGMEDEYFCNLKNSPIFVCQGQASFLADAFYNNKYSFIYPDYKDNESIINSHLSNNLNLGQIKSYDETLSPSTIKITPMYNNSIKYLHELIKEI